MFRLHVVQAPALADKSGAFIPLNSWRL